MHFLKSARIHVYITAASTAQDWRQHRSKTRKRLKERFLIRRNRTKRANFRGNPLFSSYARYNRKQLNQLIFCPLDARKLAEGKRHETTSKRLHKFTRVLWRCHNQFGTFHIPSFAWVLSAGIIAALSWTNPRLSPSQSAAFCVFVASCGFLEGTVESFYSTETCFNPLHFLSGFLWREM